MGKLTSKTQIDNDDEKAPIAILVSSAILIGIITGVIISLNKITISTLYNIFKGIYISRRENIIFIFSTLIILAIFIARQTNKNSMIRGSGVAQVEGILSNRLKVNWINIIINKFLTLTICSSSGLSIGTCGPSIQMGACVGGHISSEVEKLKKYDRYLIKSGISAGMSSVLNAPISAIIFTIEQILKNKSPLAILLIMLSSLSSYFVSKYVFELGDVVSFEISNLINTKYYWLLIVLGSILGISGIIFNKVNIASQKFFRKSKLKSEVKIAIPFIMCGLIGLLIPELLGSGSDILKELQIGRFDINTLILFTIIKFILMILSFSVLVPGGVFFPVLTLGALIGNIVGLIGVVYFGMESQYIIGFIVAGMAGQFVSILKIPITAIVLVCEITSSLNYIIPITLVVFISKATSEILIERYLLDIFPKEVMKVNLVYKKLIIQKKAIEDNTVYNIEKTVKENNRQYSDVYKNKLSNLDKDFRTSTHEEKLDDKINNT